MKYKEHCRKVITIAFLQGFFSLTSWLKGAVKKASLPYTNYKANTILANVTLVLKAVS